MQNDNSNKNLAQEMAHLEEMLNPSSNSRNVNSSKFDNSNVVAVNEEDNEDKFDELVGSYDPPKKASSLKESDVLLADPSLIPDGKQNSQVNSSTAASPNVNSESSSNNNPNASPNLSSSSNPNLNPSSSSSSSSNPNPNPNPSPKSETNPNPNPNPNISLPPDLLGEQKPSGNNALATLKPGGNWNQRFVIVGVCTAILLVSVIFHNTSGKTTPRPSSDDITKALPPPESSPRMADPSLNTYELGMPDQKLPNNKPIKKEEALPEIVIPKEVPPAPLSKSEPIAKATPTPLPEEIEEDEDFAITFRAANKLAAESLVQSNKEKARAREEEEKEERSVLNGLRIPMQLIEPLRSGIPTNVSAVVIADVKDGSGNTVVPKGSRVQIPFLAFEVQGRVTNDISANSVIVLANNKKLAVKGTVKGIDGFAGLKGKIRQQSKGNLLARTGKAIGRVGARVVGLQTGGVGGFVIEDTINESINTSLPFVPNQRVVEVMAGTPFTFNVN